VFFAVLAARFSWIRSDKFGLGTATGFTGGMMLDFLYYVGFGMATGTWVPVVVTGVDVAFHRFRQMAVLTAAILILSAVLSDIALAH
jgi:hypothetical protein